MSIAELSAAFGAPGDGPADDRLPPQDLHAEQSVLGSMLLNKDAIADCLEAVKARATQPSMRRSQPAVRPFCRARVRQHRLGRLAIALLCRHHPETAEEALTARCLAEELLERVTGLAEFAGVPQKTRLVWIEDGPHLMILVPDGGSGLDARNPNESGRRRCDSGRSSTRHRRRQDAGAHRGGAAPCHRR